MPVIFPKSVFSPFFDRRISVEGNRLFTPGQTRKVAGTYCACIFDNGFADPFADADSESAVRTYSISVLAGDWLDHEPPQVGDRVTCGDIKLAVSRVDSILGDTWELTAREVS